MILTLTILVDVNPRKIVASGPVERHADGAPDVAKILEHALLGRLQHMDGIRSARLIDAVIHEEAARGEGDH